MISPLLDAQAILSEGLRYVPLDASVLLPGQKGDPDKAFAEARMVGARRFDIDVFSDPESAYPHTVPGVARFCALMGALGLTEDTPILFYDQRGSAGACRGWWLARLFGHRDVRILDGGLKAWREVGGAVESGPVREPVPALYRARPEYGLLAGAGDVLAALSDDHRIVLDARSAPRFAAEVPEPRPGVRGGHMPGALNLDWTALLDAEGFFLKPDVLRTRFAPTAGRKVIASCGSGLTAATLLAGLEIAGLPSGAMFDGAWAEWGSDPQAPIVTGKV
ncbi:sulfurtransferase [Gluconobacter wancherniae]|uniref:sulfurtransferase n=1 Tax=Gluconobacter wancherniae TaxID=1307955 RepID=UPI001B8CBAE0|nr:sulfurtransferase [Gluconobacter wancherniae]MBS1094117.1 sulfurtransferase [Gluconobacter wancherniae]